MLMGAGLAQAAQIADRARGTGRSVGLIDERLDRRLAGVAAGRQRREDRREGKRAFARSAAVRIVEMDVADQAGRHPSPQQVGDRLRFGRTRRRASIMVRTAGLPIARTIAGRFRDRVDERRLLARQRLDAIDDAGLRGGLGHRGEAVGAALAAFVLVAGAERALIGRAVHQNARAEIGGERAQRAHHLDRAGALAASAVVIDRPSGARSR